MMRMTVKMAAVATVSLLLLFCSVISSASQETCDQYAARGGNFTVILNHSLKPTEKLRWKHKTTPIFYRNPQKSPIPAGSKYIYSIGKESDIHENGSLKLTNLMANHSGAYEPEVFQDGQTVPNLKKTFLCILDPVQKPSVKAECVDGKLEVKFSCIVSQVPSGVSFEWLLNEKPSGKLQTLTQKVKDVKEASIKCRVFNQVSSATSDGVKQSCYKSIIPEKILGVSIWIFVGGGAGVVLLLIILVIVCCVKAKRKERMQLKDEEELRLGWTNPDQQHQQHRQQIPLPEHPHHHHQHQAGHTGPRQHRTRQPRPRAPDPPNGHPQPSPRRAQTPKPVANDDDEQPPPLPQPRKKVPKTPRA